VQKGEAMVFRSIRPRANIGRTLAGQVLEVGPGSSPFPVTQSARVTYIDRRVEGGRDANWPELEGQPHGPNPHLNLNVDVDRLSPIENASFDAVIASHVIEHLANPLRALQEFHRVLRPGGRLVLIVPDRTRTFDRVREPTTVRHLLDEHARNVVEVSEEHIREFCQAIYSQRPIHPPKVREWHNPATLDSDGLALLRRRSIHVHCWAPEEFAVLIAGAISRDLMKWRIADSYFVEECGSKGEFGLVLQRPATPEVGGFLEFVSSWCDQILSNICRDPQRIINFNRALESEMDGWAELTTAQAKIIEALGSHIALSPQRKAAHLAMKSQSSAQRALAAARFRARRLTCS
jgi:SAM-dependent methyltransferase